MPLLYEIRANREKILQLAKKSGVTDIRVFGSVARGEEREDSDIDFLVNRIEGINLGLQTYAFPAAMEDMFHRKIDFVMEKNLHRVIKDRVIKEAKPI